MKNRIKTLTVATVLVVVAMLSSSCNRGMGCPNNFSIGKLVNVLR